MGRPRIGSIGAVRRGGTRARGAQIGAAALWLLGGTAILVLLTAAYFWAVMSWSYSTGERAGWVQKLSKKGWLCKTWEGELAMVSMPGATPEKFHFTVPDDEVAQAINRSMGKRVSLHYEEKVGLPTSCFGETRHFVNRVTPVDEIPLAPGITVPVPQGAQAPPASAPSPPGATPRSAAPPGSPAPPAGR